MKQPLNEKQEESLRFVANHYNSRAFDQDAAWRRITGHEPSAESSGHTFPLRRRRFAVAASIAAAVVISASAAFFTWVLPSAETDNQTSIESTDASRGSLTAVRRIEFTDAPLADVVQAIERVYGVRVGNLPVESYRLTLSYEGNARDLIATINELLGTNLRIEQ